MSDSLSLADLLRSVTASTSASDAADSSVAKATPIVGTEAAKPLQRSVNVALIGPQAARRDAIRAALEREGAQIGVELPAYPEPGQVLRAVLGCEVVVIDLAFDAELAIRLIEIAGAADAALTVMAYASSVDAGLLMQCLRAGARELFADPIEPVALREALLRAVARRPEPGQVRTSRGRILAFTGAKGGSGVTTIASNFALSLTKVSAAKVVLVDMDLRMGDASLVLGMNCRFSIVDALTNTERLDKEFLSTLLARHGSGLSILAGPESYTPMSSIGGRVSTLLSLLREEFDYIVVDAGASVGKMYEDLYDAVDHLYIVTEISIPALRAANRLISWFTAKENPPVTELVINRHDSRTIEIDDARVVKTLSHPLKWKIPNHFESVREAQNTGVPLSIKNSGPIAKVLHQMAHAAAGNPVPPEPKKKFRLFG